MNRTASDLILSAKGLARELGDSGLDVWDRHASLILDSLLAGDRRDLVAADLLDAMADVVRAESTLAWFEASDAVAWRRRAESLRSELRGYVA